MRSAVMSLVEFVVNVIHIVVMEGFLIQCSIYFFIKDTLL